MNKDEVPKYLKEFMDDPPGDEKKPITPSRGGPGNLKRARAYLAKVPGAVSGQGGHDATFRVTCALVIGFDLGIDGARPLLAEWNQSCKPPWNEKELEHKLSQAGKQPGERGAKLGSTSRPAPLLTVNGNDKAPESSDNEPPFIYAGEILSRYTRLRPPIVHGLLREGETMNVIAPPKTGKTWLTLDLALSVATGTKWLGFETVPGRVLILDNELHAETISDRLPKVALAKNLELAVCADRIAYHILRGNLKDIFTLASILRAIEPGYFEVIVLDAFYRFLPKDTDENDNGNMAALYNQIDAYADTLRCAFVLIHHTSKGLQTGRAVTDVGAGAGAIARAADCHLILRPHAEPDAVVLDAASRSWPPVPSTCLRFTFPLWTPAPDLDPTDMKRAKSKAKKADTGPASQPKPEWTRVSFVAAFINRTPKVTAAILAEANDKGLSDYAAKKLLKKAAATDLIHRWKNGPKDPESYATISQPELPLDVCVSESGFPLRENLKGTTVTRTHSRKRKNSKNGRQNA